MDYSVSNKKYLSKETTRALKNLLNKTKTIPVIQVNGKVYMERKDYRRLQNSEKAITVQGFEQVMPVYGVVQLLNLFEEKTERVSITSKSNRMVSELQLQLKKSVPMISDMIIVNSNELEIVPKGTY